MPAQAFAKLTAPRTPLIVRRPRVLKLIDRSLRSGVCWLAAPAGYGKTTAVVDTEARIKNLTGFRDNLRAMLAKPSATVKDSVDIQADADWRRSVAGIKKQITWRNRS